ncbi:hypothetical protein GcM1_242116 [Golovinomyces cichoracearum]|uniref:Uncharacterized protein n=1 Tax=Golovinomyces cichoracearum TaxID=62708 RepID=A0A420IH92_9PEZI|nr:hypothetical protein GcM1_242116 [Golovinomyces cichoracearum]
MDENARRRRLNESPYVAPDPRLNQENQNRGFTAVATERLRPAPVNNSAPIHRGVPPRTAYPGYYQVTSPSFPSNLQFQQTAGYGQDQRQQPQPSFATYSPDIMYNVSQQASQGNAYNPATQFQNRQSTNTQILSDVNNPYFPSEPSSNAEATSLQHHVTSSSAPAYSQHQNQQNQGERGPLIPHGYSNMTMSSIPQSTEAMEEGQFTSSGPGMEAAYTSYQAALKQIFSNIIQGRLSEASQSLVEISEWLLGHVQDLGLTVDEVSLHADRIRLWGEFNSAWLGIFQKQKDLLESGVRILPPQSLISQEFVNKMARHLIRMCDVVERYGLVDYQLGVAEERIMQILMESLDLQESIEKSGDVDGQSSSMNQAPP